MIAGDGATPETDSGAKKAAMELGAAVSRAAGALQAIPAGDEAAAYSCLRDLDTALTGLADLLRSVPQVVQLGDPALSLAQRLERSRQELVTRREELAAARAALDNLTEIEQHLSDITSQAHQLRSRVAELELAQQTAAEIPGLRAKTQALEQDVAALDAADAPEISARLTAAVAQLTTLTERQRASMSEAATTMVARAEAAARELEELEARRDTAAADLDRLAAEAKQLMAEHGDTLPMLAAWSKADLELAEGMRRAMINTVGTVLENVHAELSGITQRLTELDDLLGPMLAAHARAYEDARQIRSY